jgi:hypothetical protein
MWKKVLFACVAAGLLAVGAAAQSTGTIEGTVVDENAVALPGVTVEAMSPYLQGTKVAVTGTDGKFRLILLPPGTYALKFSLTGFAATEQTGVVVNLGRIVTLSVTMQSAFKEEVVVSGAAPTIDTKSTEIGSNITSDFFNNLPVGRNYANVVAVTPGAAEDAAGSTIYGSTGSENAYYIDGINTTGVELGQQGKQLNFEFIQEVQVKTGGYQAEFGRSTGGMINVITKSGGNELHGDVFAYYDADSLQADPSDEVVDNRYSRSFYVDGYTRQDYGFDLGGYFVKDKLWFFAAYDRVQNDEDRATTQDFAQYGGEDLGFPPPGTIVTDTVKRDLWSGKLTWRLAQNHSFVLSAFGDPTTEEGPVGPTLAGNEDTYMGTIDSGGTDFVGKYEGVLGTSFVVNLMYSQHREESKPSGDGVNQVALIDYTHPLYLNTGITPIWDGWGFGQIQEFGRDTYRGDISYFLSGFLGDHEFKAGYEYEDISVNNQNFNSGGQRIYRFSCNPAVRYCGANNEYEYYYRHRYYAYTKKDPTTYTSADIWNPQVVDTKSTNVAYYLQDSWRPVQNFTLSLGVRLDQQELYNGSGEVQHKIDDNWAPRVGFVWDVRGDGTSKVYGSWGYFYETIPMDIVIRSFGGEITVFAYNFSDDPDDIAGLPAGQRPRGSSVLGGGYSNVDPSTSGQYIEELVIGGEFEIAKDLVVGAKYVNRDLPQIIEDALSADGNYYIGNPSKGLMTGTYDIGYAYGYNEILHPIPEPTRTFEGFELTARKRFSSNWMMMASYLYSKLEGNYDGTFQASTGQLDPNLNSAFDYADFQVNNTGYLSNDRRHQFKIDGYYTFDFGLDLGVSAYYRTGTPITAMGYSAAYQNWEYYLSERGAFGRTDDEYEMDLHLGYPIKFGSVELNLLFDVFNLLDNQGETSRNMRYTLDEDYEVIDWNTGESLPPITPGEAERPPTNPAFNTSNAWQDPRSIRLGVRLTF